MPDLNCMKASQREEAEVGPTDMPDLNCMKASQREEAEVGPSGLQMSSDEYSF